MIGRKPIHLLKEEDRKRVPELKDLHIDIGAKDGEEARGLVRIGDVAVIDAEPVELRDGRVDLPRARQPRRLLRGGARRPGSSPSGRRARRRARARGRPGGDDVRRLAHERLRAPARRGDRRRRDVRHRPARASSSARSPSTTLGSRAGDRARDDAASRGVRAAARGRRERGDRRSPSSRSAGAPAPTPTRSTSAAPACRPGSCRCRCRYMHSPVEMVVAGRHRRGRQADRGVRGTAASRTSRSSADRDGGVLFCCSTSTARS